MVEEGGNQGAGFTLREVYRSGYEYDVPRVHETIVMLERMEEPVGNDLKRFCLQ
jgi:hypothetical protein